MTIEKTNQLSFVQPAVTRETYSAAGADMVQTKEKLSKGADVLIARAAETPEYEAGDIKYLEGNDRAQWAQSAKAKTPQELIDYAYGFVNRLGVIYTDANFNVNERSKCEVQIGVVYDELTARAGAGAAKLYNELYGANENFINNLLDITMRTYEMSFQPAGIPPYAALKGIKLIETLSAALVKEKGKLGEVSNLNLFNFINKLYGAINFVDDKKAQINKRHKPEGAQNKTLAKFSKFVTSSIDVFFEETKKRAQTQPAKLYEELNYNSKLDELFAILIQDNIKRYDIIEVFGVNMRGEANEKLKAAQGPVIQAKSEYTQKTKEKGLAAEETETAVKQKNKAIADKLALLEKKRKAVAEGKAAEEIALIDKEIAVIGETITALDAKIKTAQENITAVEKSIETKDQILTAVKSEVAQAEYQAGLAYGRLVGSAYKAIFKKFAPNTTIEIVSDSIRSATDFKIKVGFTSPNKIPKLPPLPSPTVPHSIDMGSSAPDSRPSYGGSMSSVLPIPDFVNFDISMEVDVMQLINCIIKATKDKNISETLDKIKMLNPVSNLGFTEGSRVEFDKGFYQGFKDSSRLIYELSPQKTTTVPGSK